MATQRRIQAPDFPGILQGRDRAVHDAVKLLYEAVNFALEGVSRRRLTWADVPYASSLFSANAGTWTVASGDLSMYRYLWADRLLLVSFLIQNSTTSAGMGASLELQLPLNLSAQSSGFSGSLAWSSSALDETGVVLTQASPDQTTLSLQRIDGSAWPSSETDTLTLQGALALEVG